MKGPPEGFGPIDRLANLRERVAGSRVSGPVHPIIMAAAEGELPGWAVLGARRRAHVERVALLMDAWAERLGADRSDRKRWRAAGLLHDVLREAPADELRREVTRADAEILPDIVLHGPAASARLRSEGVRDEELLLAVARHTTGHSDFGLMGRALYVADLVEPGRRLGPWRDAMLVGLPERLVELTPEVTARRLTRAIGQGKPLISHSVAFWNALCAENGSDERGNTGI
ncbi:MAG: HD domain-containing protein [Gemmatimonadetes bacterium]|nr:HD domain-containing protein [Gemmatimonadota bacterium]